MGTLNIMYFDMNLAYDYMVKVFRKVLIEILINNLIQSNNCNFTQLGPKIMLVKLKMVLL